MHYLLVDSGFSVNKTVLLLVSIHVFMISSAIAFSTFNFPKADVFLFWSFVVLIGLRLTITYRLKEKVERIESLQINERNGYSIEEFDVTQMTTKGHPTTRELPSAKGTKLSRELEV